MAILTLHHWPNFKKGLLELKRVAPRRIVIVTWDPLSPGFWLTDYFPDTLTADRQVFPTVHRRLNSLCLPILSRRQAVPRFDLEPIRLRPRGFAIPLGVESHHGPLQIFALEPEAYVVKVLGGIKLG
jgi:hypothetical protein